MPKRCIIPGCFGDRNRSVFRVSTNTDRQRREEWIKAVLDVYPDLNVGENLCVCEKHFRKSDFTACLTDNSGKIVQKVALKRKRLKSRAVPHFDMLNLNSSNNLTELDEPSCAALNDKDRVYTKWNPNELTTFVSVEMGTKPQNNVDLISTMKVKEERLYEDHEIKDEMVVGPVSLVKPGNMSSAVSEPTVKCERSPLGMIKVKVEPLDEVDQTTDMDAKADVLHQTKKEPEFDPLFTSNAVKIKKEPFDDQYLEGGSMVEIRIEAEAASAVGKPSSPLLANAKTEYYIEIEGLKHPTTATDIKKEKPKKGYGTVSKEAKNKKFHCDVCTKQFNRKSNMKIHQKRMHLGQKPFSIQAKKKQLHCDLCKKQFNRTWNLNLHKKRMHQERKPSVKKENPKKNDGTTIEAKDKPFQCDVCQKRFNRKSNLKIHQGMHQDKKPFSCNLCDKTFLQRTNLMSHMLGHTGEKPFSCDVCQKKFTHKIHMTQHYRVHTGEKPFACDMCDKRYNDKINLTRHRFMHSGIKPFQCDTCDKKFYQKSNLQQHMKLHTGEKPYLCKVCDKRFNRKYNLKKHSKIHTEGELVK